MSLRLQQDGAVPSLMSSGFSLPQLARPSVLPPVQTAGESDASEQPLSPPSLPQPPSQLWPEHPEHSVCIRVVYSQTLRLRPTTIFSFLKGMASRPAFSPS